MANEKAPRQGEDSFNLEYLHGSSEVRQRASLSMLFAERGGGSLTLGNGRFAFIPGDVMLIPQGSDARLETEGEDTRAVLLSIRAYYLSEEAREAFCRSAPVVRSAALSGVVREMTERISSELRIGDAMSRDAARAIATELLAAVLRAENEFAPSTQLSHSVSATLDYIERHSAERITLSDMAAACKVSEAYLSRRFKAEVGIGFADYVASVRLNRAEIMLREMPKMSITEIAFSCGFNDSNYFSDKFKKHFGISPLKFRKSK